MNINHNIHFIPGFVWHIFSLNLLTKYRKIIQNTFHYILTCLCSGNYCKSILSYFKNNNTYHNNNNF